MADTKVNFSMIVFDVRDPDVTCCYVLIEPAPGDPQDCDPDIFGWHGKAYGSKLTTAEIHNMLFRNQKHNPLFWPKMAPKL